MLTSRNNKNRTIIIIPWLLLVLLSLTTWQNHDLVVHAADEMIPLDAAFMELADELLRLPYQQESAGQQNYESYKKYKGIKDEAVLAKTKDGKCLLFFPGTNGLNPLDVFQNFLPGFQQVCPIDLTVGGECCQARSGYYSGYDTYYRAELEGDVAACVATCLNADECLYISGHSQGGSVARIAAIRFQYANPIVISFANGRTLNAECTQLNSSRWIRFVNTRAKFYKGLIYDPWPFFSQIDHKAYNHGVTYIFSEDVTALATVTVNAYERVGPLDWSQIAHAIDFDVGWLHLGAGYLNRIARIIDNGVFPVPTNGFSSGYYCTRDEECQSKSCKGLSRIFRHWIRKCE